MSMGVIIANIIILCSLFSFIKNAITYKHKKRIAGYDMVFLSPDKEFKFMIKIICTRIFSLLTGCFVLTMELGKQGSEIYDVDIFIVTLTLITVTIELFLRKIGYPKLYEKLRGGCLNEKVNYYKM